jgi:hypothetical protein
MVTNTIPLLFSALASLLMSMQSNSHVSSATLQEAVALTNQSIQIAAQVEAAPRINFPVTPNNGFQPNITDVYNSAFLDPNGNYVQLSPTAVLIPGDTSFGDLNGDGVDDAAVVVQEMDANGNWSTQLAALLNQGGVMFNIADAELAAGTSTLQIFSHNIVGGEVVLNMQVGNGPIETSTYMLVGEQLVKEEN